MPDADAQDQLEQGRQIGANLSPDEQMTLGKQLGASLPRKHALSLIQQISQAGKGQDPFSGALGINSSLGSAASDPAPADADMQQLGVQPTTTPPSSPWAGPRGLATADSRRAIMANMPSRVNYAAADPSLGAQNQDVTKLRDIADQVQGAPNKTNLSAIAAYVDHIAGTGFAKDYQAPLSDDQKAVEAAKLRSMAAGAQNNITRDQIQSMVAQARNEGAMTRTLAAQATKGDKADAKTNDDLNKQMLKFGTDADALTQKRNTIGQIANTGYRAAHVASLLDRYNDGDKLSAPEMQELGTAVASMLSGGAGQIAQSQVSEFAPSGVGKTAAEVESFLTNAPQDTNMNGWVQRLGSTARSLGAQSEMQMKDFVGGVADRNQALYDSDDYRPKLYRMMAHKGFTKADVDQIFSQNNLDQQANAYKGLQVTDTPGGVYSGQIVPAANLNKFRLGGIPKDAPPMVNGKPVDPAKYQAASATAKKIIWDAYSKTQPDSE